MGNRRRWWICAACSGCLPICYMLARRKHTLKDINQRRGRSMSLLCTLGVNQAFCLHTTMRTRGPEGCISFSRRCCLWALCTSCCVLFPGKGIFNQKKKIKTHLHTAQHILSSLFDLVAVPPPSLVVLLLLLLPNKKNLPPVFFFCAVISLHPVPSRYQGYTLL